jgi:hypothetical protein
MRLTDERIGAELRALRPTPERDFAAELDRRMAGGFAPEPESGGGGVARPRAKWRARPLHRRTLLPALGALALSAVVIAVVASNSGNGGGGTSTSGPELLQPTTGAGASPPASVAAPRQSGGVQEALPPTAPAPPIGGRPRNGQPQVQQRSASIGLSTDADKLQGAADGVVDVTDRYDGYVDSSDVQSSGAMPHASFSLRIPTTHLQDALADLSNLGHLVSSDEGSVNVTDAYVTAGKTYADARAHVDALLARLRSASSPSDAAAIRRQLDVARQQLAVARSGLRGLKQRVALTPVTVQIAGSGDGSWSIGDAANDAVGVLEAIGGGALIALAVLVPLGVIGWIGWAGTREVQRRRREAPLDR